MCLHKLRRRQSHPLIERHIGEVVALEDFEKAHGRVAGILDVVAHCKGNETDIAGAEVEGAGLTRSAESEQREFAARTDPAQPTTLQDSSNVMLRGATFAIALLMLPPTADASDCARASEL